jgi:hypothetical protein
VSNAPAGWYPDAANPTRERLWTGERWIKWIRTARIDRVEDPPAGWYADPGHEGSERLWSGEMWTEETRPLGTGDAEPVALAPTGVESSAAATATAAGVPAAMVAQPPRAVGSYPPGVGQATVTYYDDSPPDRLGRLAILVGITLGFTILAAIAELILGQAYIGVVDDRLDGRSQSVHHIQSVIDSVHTMLWVSPLIDLLAAVVFIVWFHRAYRNLVRAGIRDLRFGPGWAIGGWFIPFFNAVRQKKVANDIWKASASAGTIGPERRQEMGLSDLLNWWWGVWIAAWVAIALGESALTQASVERVLYSDNLDGARSGAWTHQAGLVLAIAAAVLAFLFVRQVSKLQDANFRKPEHDPDAFHAPHAWSRTPPVARTAPDPGLAPPPLAATKVCPECAEEVKAAARVCRYCGHRFDPEG